MSKRGKDIEDIEIFYNSRTDGYSTSELRKRVAAAEAEK